MLSTKPRDMDLDFPLHVAKGPSRFMEPVSNIQEHEPGPLPDVTLPGSKSLLLEEPSAENDTVIDVPSSENRAWISMTETEV